jgi:hypothetical protein
MLNILEEKKKRWGEKYHRKPAERFSLRFEFFEPKTGPRMRAD